MCADKSNPVDPVYGPDDAAEGLTPMPVPVDLLPEPPSAQPEPVSEAVWIDEESDTATIVNLPEPPEGHDEITISTVEFEPCIYKDENGLSVHALSGVVTTTDGQQGSIQTGHVYEIRGTGVPAVVAFQQGAVPKNGVNGVTNEALLQILIHRTEIINSQFPCDENFHALSYMRAALNCFNDRTARRKSAGIKDTYVEEAKNSHNFLLSEGGAKLVFNGSCLDPDAHQDYGYIISVSSGSEHSKSCINLAQVWGADTAFGSGARRVNVVLHQSYDPNVDVKFIVNEILKLKEAYPTASLVVDDVGHIGKYFGHALKEAGLAYKGVYLGGQCFQNTHRMDFNSKRSHAYVHLCKAIMDNRFKIVDATSIYHDQDAITSQLAKIAYHFDDKSRYIIASDSAHHELGISHDLIRGFAFLFMEGVTYKAVNGLGATIKVDTKEVPVFPQDADDKATIKRLLDEKKENSEQIYDLNNRICDLNNSHVQMQHKYADTVAQMQRIIDTQSIELKRWQGACLGLTDVIGDMRIENQGLGQEVLGLEEDLLAANSKIEKASEPDQHFLKKGGGVVGSLHDGKGFAGFSTKDSGC